MRLEMEIPKWTGDPMYDGVIDAVSLFLLAYSVFFLPPWVVAVGLGMMLAVSWFLFITNR